MSATLFKIKESLALFFWFVFLTESYETKHVIIIFTTVFQVVRKVGVFNLFTNAVLCIYQLSSIGEELMFVEFIIIIDICNMILL